MIAEDPNLSIFSKNYQGEKTFEDLHEALMNCDMHIWQHDYYSMQDSVVGYYVSPNQRYRCYCNGFMRIFRLEISETVLNLPYNPQFIPKL